MKIYIFNYLDNKGKTTKSLATASKETADYAINFANEKNWEFNVQVVEVKTQGKNFNMLEKIESYYEMPF